MNLDNIFQLVMILLLVLIVICIVIRIKKIENIENIDEHYSNIIENFKADIIPMGNVSQENISGSGGGSNLENKLDILSNKVSALENKSSIHQKTQEEAKSKLQKKVDSNTKYIKYIQEEEKALQKKLKN